jgi:hypothetical protein
MNTASDAQLLVSNDQLTEVASPRHQNSTASETHLKHRRRDHRAVEAITEVSTVVGHATGHDNWTPRHIAMARTPDGLRLIVGLPGLVEAGSLAYLTERGGAPFALASTAARE